MRYIYCITNLINGKTYFGQRTLTEGRTFETDTYRGSGKLLKLAYNKYGKENFKRECILIGDFTKEEINRFERCIIACQRVCGKAEYNIADGGEGWSEGMREAHWKSTHTDYHRECSRKQMILLNQKKTFEDRSKSSKKAWANNPNIGTTGYVFSEEQKKKLSESHKSSKNSQFGTHWYTNGEVNIKAKECPEGFKPGRTYNDVSLENTQ